MLTALSSLWKRGARQHAAQTIVLSPALLAIATLAVIVATVGLGALLLTSVGLVDATTGHELPSQLDGPTPVLLYALTATVVGTAVGQLLIARRAPAWLQEDYEVDHPATYVVPLVLVPLFLIGLYYFLGLLDWAATGLGLVFVSWALLGIVWSQKLWTVGASHPSRIVRRRIAGTGVLLAAFGAVVIGGVGPSLSLESWRVLVLYAFITTTSIAVAENPVTSLVESDLKAVIVDRDADANRPVVPEPWRPIDGAAVENTPNGPIDDYLTAAGAGASDTDAIVDYGVTFAKIEQRVDGNLQLWVRVGDLHRPETVAAILALQLHPRYYETDGEQARAAAVLEDTYRVLAEGSSDALVGLTDGDLLAGSGPAGGRLDRIETIVARGLPDDEPEETADDRPSPDESSGDYVERAGRDVESGGRDVDPTAESERQTVDEAVPSDVGTGADEPL